MGITFCLETQAFKLSLGDIYHSSLNVAEACEPYSETYVLQWCMDYNKLLFEFWHTNVNLYCDVRTYYNMVLGALIFRRSPWCTTLCRGHATT